MRKKYCIYLLAGILILFVSCKDQSVSPKKADFEFNIEELQAELENQLYPLQSTDPYSSTDDLSPLASLANAQVIGLGEATHGTKEFFQMKHKIFRYLVENHGVRVFAFEADMGESIYINRYIQGEEGDLKEIMSDKMQFWTWRTEEVMELIEWMRSYNLDKPESERLHYIGTDTQFLKFQPQLIEDYLKKTASESFFQEARDVLNTARNLGNEHFNLAVSYIQMKPEEYEKISDEFQFLIDRFGENETELIVASSTYEYQTHRQLAVNLLQTHHNTYSYQNNGPAFRDQFMAENIQWIPKLFNEETKIAVWAHNVHVMRSADRIGFYLKEAMGDRYQIVGFSFCWGSFTAVGVDQRTGTTAGLQTHQILSKPIENSYNSLFYTLDTKNFILKLEDLSGQLNDYFSESNNLRTVGSVYDGDPSLYYMKFPMKTTFDYLIHIDRSRPTETFR